MTGMQTRRGGTGKSARAGWPACDYRTGDLSAFVIPLALYRRLRTGIDESQHLQGVAIRHRYLSADRFHVDFAGRRWDEPIGLAASDGAALSPPLQG